MISSITWSLPTPSAVACEAQGNAIAQAVMRDGLHILGQDMVLAA